MATEKERRKKGAEAAAPAPSFETSLGRLEEIVARLESGELGLDESLTLFEEGVGLSRFCQGKLADVERKVEQVLRATDGSIRTVPLEGAAAERGAVPAGDDDVDDDDDAPF